MGATEDWLASIGKTNGAKTALVLSADPRSPDELASHAQIGAQLGLPPIVIGSDPEAFKARAAEKSIADAVKDAPKTAAWLQERDNGGIAKDDVANLSWFEKGLKDWEASGDTGVSRAIVRGTKSLAGSMQGFGAIQSAITAADIGLTKEQIIAREVAALGPNPDVSMVAAAQQAALIKYDAVSGMTEEEKAAMLQGASGRLQIARDTLAKAADIPRSGIAQEGADTWAAAPNTLMGKLGTIAQNPAAVLAFLGETAAESLPALIPATVATLASRNPVVGAGVMGATSGYLTASTEAMGFLESRGIKMETPDDVLEVLSNQDLMLEARQYGLDKGLIVGALDALSGGVAGKTLMQSPVGEAIAQSVAQALFGGGGEALAQLAVDGELDWGAVLIEGLAEFVTAPAEMISVGRGWLKSSAEKAARAGTTAGKIEAIDKMAAESKVKARSPEKMADLLDRVMDGKSLYVPAEDLNELFQAKEFGPADWGIDPATFDEMLASGGDIAIPAATYASKITGTENADWFKQNAKTSVGEMSAMEATRFNEEVRGVIEQQMAMADADRQSMQELRASDVQVKDQLYSMLREAGHTKDVADTNARVVAAAIRTMAQRSGQDPLDMAKRFGLEIKGPQTNEMRRRGNLDIALNTLRKGAVQKPGASLTDFVIGKGGLQDVGGDLAAMDAPKGVVAETRDEVAARASQPSLMGLPSIGKGKGLDDMARAAVEAGYFPDLQGQPEDGLANVLMDALRAEMAGEKRFIPGQEGNADLQGLAAELDRRGIDLAMSNDEIAAKLQEADGLQYKQGGGLSDDEAVSAVLAAVTNFADEYDIIGLRITDDTFSVGDTPENSRVWADGEPTGETLDGVSAVGVKPNEKSVRSALRDAGLIRGGQNVYLGKNVYLIASDRAQVGEDAGELVMESPTVIATFERTSDMGPLSAVQERTYNQSGQLRTDTAAFRKWFGDSKVVGPDGEPLVVYHGTGKDFEAFDPSRSGSSIDSGFLGAGIYMTNRPRIADYYAEIAAKYGAGQNLMPLYVSLQNPFMWGEKTFGVRDLVNLGTPLPTEVHQAVIDRTGFEFDPDQEPDYTWERTLSAALTDVLKERGYDGVIASTNDGAAVGEIVAFSPTQIKSVNNRGTWDANDPRILFQGDTAQEQPLYVVHNLSAEKLRHAVDLGGLAAPSLAIARGDIGFDNFGEISLIGDPKMADPKGKGVRAFNADVYSPRQPRAKYKVSAKDARKVFDAIKDVAPDLGFVGRLDDGDIAGGGMSAIAANIATKAAWLKSNGEAIPVVRGAPNPAPSPVDGMEAFTSTDWFDLRNDVAFAAAVSDARRRMAEDRRATNPALADAILDKAFDSDGVLHDDLLINQARMVANRNRDIADYVPDADGPTDQYRTALAVDEAIAGREDEYSVWVESKFGSAVGKAFFESEAGRKFDYTLSNLVREMTKTLRNGEKWNYGAGNVRAAVAPEFKSLSDIKASRGQIADSDAVGKLRDEVSGELFTLADKFAPFVGSEGQRFGWGDTFSEFLRDVAKGPRAVATWPWAGDVPTELMNEARAFLAKLKDLPTEYFEIKMQRAVGLDEFTAAVVPSNASAATVKALKDAGLQIVTYDRSVEGARKAALQQVGERVFFQPAWHGTPSKFSKFTTDRIGTGTGEKAFGWGLYFAGRKEIAKHYRDSLSGMRKSKVERALSKHGGDVDAAIAGVNAEIDRLATLFLDANGKAMQARKIAAQQETLQALDDYKQNGNNAGRLFKVDIPEDSDLLNWEVSLAKQPRTVREKMQSLINEVAANARMNEADRKEIARGKATGELFYRALAQYLAAKNQTGIVSDDAAASLALKDAGIPGHRLFDGPSANAGFMERKQYNYVIYDENAVNVLEYDQPNRASIIFPAGGVDNGQTVINMFENSDLSSFQHEIGHYMLEVFNVLAGENSAPQDMRDDMAAIQKYLGMEPGAKPTVEQHELFARTWEAYLMEGKSPTLELADAFARFKAWMLRIYQTVAGLKVKINPEIRAVLDRMIATDEEIRAARAEQAMKPLFTDETAAGMTPGAFQTYQRMARRATEQAEQSLLEKTMAVERRKMEAWWKAEYKQVLDQVTKSINSQRPYRLTEMLANQVWMSDTPKTVPDMQIDRKQLVDMFGAGVLAELSREKLGGKRAIYKDGGASPMEVADLFGFANPQEMVDILQNAGKRKDAIRAETDRIMRDRYGDPLTDGSIESAALEAIHSEQQAMTVASEVRHLAGRAGVSTRNLTAQVFRQRARLMLGRMTVSEAGNPNAFLAAGRKAARRAEDAFARVASGKDSQDALMAATRHKEQQLLNHYLYLESRDFARELDSGREKMRGYTKASVRAKLEGGYIEQIDTLLDAYDFRVQSKKQVARAESLTAFVQRMTDAGRAGELAIDQRVIDRAKKVHYSRLSVDELRGLFDTIANIDHLGRFKKSLLDARRRRDLDASVKVVTDAAFNVYGMGKNADKNYVRNTFNLLWTMDTMLMEYDGMKEMGAVYDEVKRDIDMAGSVEQKMQIELTEKVDSLFGVYSAKEIAAMQKPKVIQGGNGRPWAKVEILSVALNMGNENNRQRMFDNSVHPSNRLTPDQAAALVATLDARDWAFVKAYAELINSYWPDLSEVSERRTGTKPKKVAAVPFDTPVGQMPGWYYPIIYDPALSARAATDESSAWDSFLATGWGARAEVNSGMTKERAATGGGRALNFDLAEGISHMKKTIRLIALSEAVDNSFRILNDKRVVQAMQDAGRQGDLNVWNLWLKDVAQGLVIHTDTLSILSRNLKNNFTLSRLAFNMKMVVMQSTGLAQSAAVIGKKNLFFGLTDYLKRPRALSEEVIAKSAFMAERQSTMNKDIHDYANDVRLTGPMASRYGKFKGGIGKWGFAPFSLMQFYSVDMPTWLGAYRSGLEQFNDDAKAMHYADRMVERSQGGGVMADRTAFARGTVNKGTQQSEFIRLFSTLGGYMITKMNRGYIEVKRAKVQMSQAETATESVLAATNAATNLFLIYVAEAAAMAVIYAMIYGFDDDDKDPEDYAKFIAAQTAGAVVGGVPFGKDAATAFQGYGAGGVLGSVLEMPANFYVQAVQGENDKALRRSAVDLVGTITGFPSVATMRVIEGAIAEEGPSMAEMFFGQDPIGR